MVSLGSGEIEAMKVYIYFCVTPKPMNTTRKWSSFVKSHCNSNYSPLCRTTGAKVATPIGNSDKNEVRHEVYNYPPYFQYLTNIFLQFSDAFDSFTHT